MRPTDKPTANQEAVYRGTARLNEKSTKKSTSQGLPTSRKPTGKQSTETLRSRKKSLPRSRPVKSYRQAKRLPGCNLLRRTQRSTEKSPEKLIGIVYQVDKHSIEACFGDRNYEVDWMFTEADFAKTITASRSIYESMPVANDYRLQDILYRACGSTAQSSDSTSALELGKNNNLREPYRVDIDE
jgi:hypothetical protein